MTTSDLTLDGASRQNPGPGEAAGLPVPAGGDVLMTNPTPYDLQENFKEEAEDEDDVTVIVLDHVNGDDDDGGALIDRNSPEMQERRRNVLLRELQRVQRASFLHFFILCMIPVSLLIVVIATVLRDEEPCESELTNCVREERAFINAFTTRCVCDAVSLSQGPDP